MALVIPVSPSTPPAEFPRLVRRPDWPERFYEALRARRRLPFRWGQTDCCLTAADLILAMTGVDLAAGLRGTYESAEEAQAVCRKFVARHPEVARRLDVSPVGDGCSGLIIVLAELHGMERIDDPLRATRGDLVLVQGRIPERTSNRRYAWASPIVAGVVDHGSAWLPAFPGGMAVARRETWTAAWRVG